MIEVSVSVPNDRGTMFAETATAEPELESSDLISVVRTHVGIPTEQREAMRFAVRNRKHVCGLFESKRNPFFVIIFALVKHLEKQ